MFYVQFHHGYFGWLGGEPGDLAFPSLAQAEAYLYGCEVGVRRRVIDEQRRVRARLHRDGRVEVYEEVSHVRPLHS